MKAYLLALVVFFSGISLAQAKESDNNKIKAIKIKTTAQCGQCKERIEKALAYEKGVKSSNLDLETRVLTVVYNSKKTTETKVRTVIAKLGYDADDVKKDMKAYKNLPACCKLPSDPDYRGH